MDGANTSAHRNGSTLAASPVAATFAAVSLAIWLVDAGFSVLMARAPHLSVWLALMVLQGAIAGAGLVPCWSVAFQFRDRAKHARLAMGLSFVGVAVLLALPIVVLPPIVLNIFGDDLPFVHVHIRTVASACLTALPGFGAVAAIWMVGMTDLDERDQREVPAAATELSRRNNILRRLLAFLGLQVGTITLTTGALRVALIEGGWAAEKHYPAEAVLVYGVYFAFIIVLVYLPSHFALQRRAERIRRDILERSRLKSTDWLNQRSYLDEALGLKSTWTDMIVDGVWLLAPLIGANLSLLLGV